MGSFDQYTAEELAANSGPQLLAHHVKELDRQKSEMYARHERDLAELRQALDEAQRIGVKVLALRSKGRRTVRIADVCS